MKTLLRFSMLFFIFCQNVNAVKTFLNDEALKACMQVHNGIDFSVLSEEESDKKVEEFKQNPNDVIECQVLMAAGFLDRLNLLAKRNGL